VAASLLESPTAGFTVLDVRGHLRPAESLMVVGGIENLTDRNYREHLDFRSQSGISMYQPVMNIYCGTEFTY
jgi:outer membrane receptor protein involved in Fe transport